MDTQKTKVLLVDDSGFMRIILSDIVNSYSDVMVIDTAVNGKEAVQKNTELKPDVILLDLTMKDYDGLYAIKNIMVDNPTPIVILSSIRSTNPDAVIEALEAGAYDFLDKPHGMIGSKIRDIEGQIYKKIKQAALIDRKSLTVKNKSVNTYDHTFDHAPNYDVIVIGSSTGGTGAIETILQNIPGNLPLSIVIAQHMPEEFIQSFANRLNNQIPLHVKVAEHNEYLKKGTVYLLPGSTNTKIVKISASGTPKFQFTEETFKEFNCPSIDCLLLSVADIYGNKGMGIILTGMGKDGTQGLKKMFEKGAYTIAQDAATSIVYGMPKSAFEAGCTKAVLPLKEMSGFIVSALD